jgi:hypothetical protein
MIQAMGVKTARLTNSRGFAVELCVAAVVILASRLGLPMSSTPATVGAIAGVGLWEGRRGFNTRLFLRFCAGWVVTIVASVLMTMAFTAQGLYRCLGWGLGGGQGEGWAMTAEATGLMTSAWGWAPGLLAVWAAHSNPRMYSRWGPSEQRVQRLGPAPGMGLGVRGVGALPLLVLQTGLPSPLDWGAAGRHGHAWGTHASCGERRTLCTPHPDEAPPAPSCGEPRPVRAPPR